MPHPLRNPAPRFQKKATLDPDRLFGDGQLDRGAGADARARVGVFAGSAGVEAGVGAGGFGKMHCDGARVDGARGRGCGILRGSRRD